MTQQKTHPEQHLDTLLSHLNPSVAIGVAAGVAAGVAGKWLWDNSEKVTLMLDEGADQVEAKFDEFSQGNNQQSEPRRQRYWEEDSIDEGKINSRRIPIH